jgi:serine/threonine protein kinase
VEDNPHIKIIDFGLSNYVEILAKNKEGNGSDYSLENICGTPNYVAPEALRRDTISYEVDNFAIGVIIFFM